VTATIDQLVAKSMQLTGAGVLFVAPCRYCGPGPGVLLMQAKDGGLWDLPSYDVAPDANLDSPAILGDVLISRCKEEFQPVLGEKYADHCWTSPDFAVTCTSNHPRATVALENFLAENGGLHSQGENQMEDRSQFTAAQAKADRVARAYGDADGAPPFMNGESRRGYRIRLLSPFLKHSKVYKDVDPNNVQDETAFTAMEDAIYADAAVALRDPATFKPGELRAIVTRDQSGREITKYIGQDGACWDRFNPPIRHVGRFNVPGSAA
jgi:hypothetical protein